MYISQNGTIFKKTLCEGVARKTSIGVPELSCKYFGRNTSESRELCQRENWQVKSIILCSHVHGEVV